MLIKKKNRQLMQYKFAILKQQLINNGYAFMNEMKKMMNLFRKMEKSNLFAFFFLYIQ